ncbi:MAG: hypothetical protein NUW21_07890, partial [Elusimicrobia bacterium]|nr:hypothetical protein [Elusimicrobiota bacterium]
MSFSTIYLAPSGRYCNVTWWDMGGAETGECGRVRLDEDRLVEGWWARKWGSNRRDAPPFLLIPWGVRRYLIPEDRIIDFINDVNAADEPRFGRRYSSAYLRSDGRDALVLGHPDVPEKYRTLLLPAPLMTTAVEIGSRTNIVTRYDTYEDEDCGAPASFDAGSSSGVFVGMKLYAQNGDVQADVVIAKVATGSSSGRIKQFDCDKSDPLPPGTRFSTRPSWQLHSAVSTEPLITEILFASAKRFPPIFGGTPEHFFLDDPYAGAEAEGFTVEPVATVKFRGPFPGALELKVVQERMNRTMLSLGGNMFAWAEERPDLAADAAGGIEIKTAVVHRLSYVGETVEPDHEFHVRAAPQRRGERLR